jgi:hypothetical protein
LIDGDDEHFTLLAKQNFVLNQTRNSKKSVRSDLSFAPPLVIAFHHRKSIDDLSISKVGEFRLGSTYVLIITTYFLILHQDE